MLADAIGRSAAFDDALDLRCYRSKCCLASSLGRSDGVQLAASLGYTHTDRLEALGIVTPFGDAAPPGPAKAF